MSGFRLGRDAAGNRIKIPYTEAEERALAERMAPMIAAHEHAKMNGLGKGHGGIGSVSCPRCKTGMVRYTVASCNGHMHGVCSTPFCCSWME